MWKMWKKRAMHRVSFLLTKHLLKAVHEDELLIFTNKGWYFNKNRLTDEQVATLREEAREFEGSFLWRLMSNEVKFLAYLRGSNKARHDEDLIFSGAMYYDLELLEQFLKNCRNL